MPNQCSHHYKYVRSKLETCSFIYLSFKKQIMQNVTKR